MDGNAAFTTASAIVPVHNDAARLAGCLDSLKRQGPALVQIILIDDASQDGSLQVLESFAANEARAEVLHHEVNQGLARTLNEGIQRARGDAILIIQQDCELISDTYVDRGLVLLGARTHCTIAGCPRYPVAELNRAELAFGLLRNHFVPALPEEELAFSEFKCDLVPRTAFSNRLFDPTFRVSGEDQDMSIRLRRDGYRILRFSHLAYVQRYGAASSVAQLLRREVVYGKGEAGVLLVSGHRIATESARSPSSKSRLQNRVLSVLFVVGVVGVAFLIAARAPPPLLLFPGALVIIRYADLLRRRGTADPSYEIGAGALLMMLGVSPIADFAYAAAMLGGFVSFFATRHV